VVFNPIDIGNLKNSMPPAPWPVRQQDVPAVASGLEKVVSSLEAVLARLAAAPLPALPPGPEAASEAPLALTEPYLLTLKQARAASGLPLKAVRPLAVKIGGRLRVNRLDLVEFTRQHRHPQTTV
jgi:hypothetical protein